MPQTHSVKLNAVLLKDGVLRASSKDTEFAQKVLKAAKMTNESGKCLCKPVEPLRPKLRQLSVRSRSDKYHLARFPNTGDQHHPRCGFYAAPSDLSGTGCYVPDVREEQGDRLRIQLNFGRAIGENVDRDILVNAQHDAGRGRARYRRMTALGLLHELWEASKLNLFTGFHRPSLTAQREVLMDAASNVIWGGGALDERLIVIAPGGSEQGRGAEIQESHGTIDQAIQANERIVIVGALREIRESRYGKPIIALSEGLANYEIRLQALEPLKEFWERRYHSALHAHACRRGGIENPYISYDPDFWIFGLFVGEPKRGEGRGEKSPRYVIDVVSGGFMLTSSEYIPVDSSHEIRLLRQLVESEREFLKPLRFEDTRDLVLPDFLLLDVGEDSYPLEVYGMREETYQHRKAEKERYYQDKFAGRHWAWVADSLVRSEVQDFHAACQMLPGKRCDLA